MSAVGATSRPVVFRNGLLLTMDDAHTVVEGADVLVIGDRIAAVGVGLAAPDDAIEIDATGGIVMPGMIDTHRHLWQTAMRGYGADWTLTQYFVWYYLEWGKVFRPQDIHAGNLLGGIEPGKKGDVVLIKNDASPAVFPVLNPYGHVVFRAQRGDVHTVVVDGRVVKADGRLVGDDLAPARQKVGQTVDFLRETPGEQAWKGGMNPDIPQTAVLDNPYQYTDFASGATHGQQDA